MKKIRILSKYDGLIIVEDARIEPNKLCILSEISYKKIKRLYGDAIEFLEEIDSKEAKEEAAKISSDKPEIDLDPTVEKAALKEELDKLGITYPNNAGVAKLKQILENNK